ncbi:Yip5p NDAI_0G03650 [Naumovozyma dairenensis CBS 421]|uniref:Protein YIP n=1 Tax=Naumovozyma dairenensis (strain ATCC 10597 / BCRC 20456 / CBS 421 / NBRC 0211 / NRRL Y-12639) TaxID=1071378 RepID=G0WED1_NAUDC|nr:hypothetical protein NDAI_0G03650 [Naumovozyma dairenensis CBS 421]CCD26142.2 hypothetical protein NDAI_0G03650 [Naumovozyma dairenensis CBS 421]
MSQYGTTSSNHNNSNSILDIDDDLEGVDDFLNEPNPFEDPANEINHDNSRGNAVVGATDDQISADGPINNNYNNNNNNNRDGGQEFMSSNSMKNVPLQPTTPPPPLNENSNKVENDVGNQKKLGPGLLNYYSQFFQLNSKQLISRIKFTFKLSISKQMRAGGDDDNVGNVEDLGYDLYSAVWIPATVIMTNFITNGLISMIVDNIIKGIIIVGTREVAKDTREEHFVKLLHSIWIFFGYTFLVPIISWNLFVKNRMASLPVESSSSGLSSSLKKLESVTDLISVYGYSNVFWVPCCIILDIILECESLSHGHKTVSIILKVMEWFIFVGFGGILSLAYIIKVIINDENGAINDKKNYGTFLFSIVLHVGFCYLLKRVIF